MGFLHCENMSRGFIDSFGMNGLSNKRMGLEEKDIQKKKNVAQLLAPFLLFLVVLFLIAKMILIKNNLKKILLFIAKKLVPL
jgi:hypothetical protein